MIAYVTIYVNVCYLSQQGGARRHGTPGVSAWFRTLPFSSSRDGATVSESDGAGLRYYRARYSDRGEKD